MKPQAASHTRARPPWAPGSGRDGGVWPHPPPGSEAGEQPCGKSARASSWLLPSGTRQTQTRRTDTSGSERTGHAGGRNVCPWG